MASTFQNLLLGASLLLTAGAASAQHGNVLVILADDVGTDMISGYGVGLEPPATPRIDMLMEAGVSFSQAWSSPWCSPTRANILTGRYNFRTGVGNLVQPDGTGLDPMEVTLPEALDASTRRSHAHAWIGKWHLANGSDHSGLAPIIAGFDHAIWTNANLGGDDLDQAGFDGHRYWPYRRDGVPAESHTYSAAAQVDFCVEWIGQQEERPWVLFFSPNLAHAPWPTPPGFVLEVDPNDPNDRIVASHRYKANVEYLDQEIGRLLDSIPTETLNNTTVIFASDNGTPDPVGVGPFPETRRKGTIYQGGIQVPLVISNPGITAPGRMINHPVSLVDLYCTVLDLAGGDADPCVLHGNHLDSKSLTPYLSNPMAQPVRRVAYTDLFDIGYPNENYIRAITDGRYKMIQRKGQRAEFYDLRTDPQELVDLNLAPMSFVQIRIFRNMKKEIADLHRSESF